MPTMGIGAVPGRNLRFFAIKYHKLIQSVCKWAHLSSKLRCKFISVGFEGSQIGIGAKGKLICSREGNGTEFTIKPSGDPDSYKFFVLVDGMQKLISVCDTTDVPSLVLMKDNKNLQQVFKLKAVEGQGQGGSTCFLTCEISGSEHFVTVADDDTALILSEPSKENDKQKWKVVSC